MAFPLRQGNKRLVNKTVQANVTKAMEADLPTYHKLKKISLLELETRI